MLQHDNIIQYSRMCKQMMPTIVWFGYSVCFTDNLTPHLRENVDVLVPTVALSLDFLS